MGIFNRLTELLQCFDEEIYTGYNLNEIIKQFLFKCSDNGDTVVDCRDECEHNDCYSKIVWRAFRSIYNIANFRNVSKGQFKPDFEIIVEEFCNKNSNYYAFKRDVITHYYLLEYEITGKKDINGIYVWIMQILHKKMNDATIINHIKKIFQNVKNKKYATNELYNKIDKILKGGIQDRNYINYKSVIINNELHFYVENQNIDFNCLQIDTRKIYSNNFFVLDQKLPSRIKVFPNEEINIPRLKPVIKTIIETINQPLSTKQIKDIIVEHYGIILNVYFESLEKDDNKTYNERDTISNNFDYTENQDNANYKFLKNKFEKDLRTFENIIKISVTDNKNNRINIKKSKEFKYKLNSKIETEKKEMRDIFTKTKKLVYNYLVLFIFSDLYQTYYELVDYEEIEDFERHLDNINDENIERIGFLEIEGIKEYLKSILGIEKSKYYEQLNEIKEIFSAGYNPITTNVDNDNKYILRNICIKVIRRVFNEFNFPDKYIPEDEKRLFFNIIRTVKMEMFNL